MRANACGQELTLDASGVQHVLESGARLLQTFSDSRPSRSARRAGHPAVLVMQQKSKAGPPAYQRNFLQNRNSTPILACPCWAWFVIGVVKQPSEGSQKLVLEDVVREGDQRISARKAICGVSRYFKPPPRL